MNDRIDPAKRDAVGASHPLPPPAPAVMLKRRSDAKGRARDVNGAWLEYTGRPAERTLGDGWLDDVHPEDRARCASIHRAMAEAQQPYAIDYRLRHAGGGYRWVMEHAEPERRNDGTVDGYRHHAVDVDERTRQAHELAGRAHRLRQALHHQAHFAAALARDLHVLPLPSVAESLVTMARLARGSGALELGRWQVADWLRAAVDAATAPGQAPAARVSVAAPAIGAAVDIDRPLLTAALAAVLRDAARGAAIDGAIDVARSDAQVQIEVPGRDGGSPCALLACALECHGGELVPLPGAARLRMIVPLANGR